MDSLLSNAQRCSRKADSLAGHGLFDQALEQLDNAIGKNEKKKSQKKIELPPSCR